MKPPATSDKRLAPQTPPLGDVLEFLRVIWQLDHALQRISKQMGATLGVTGPQRLVLRIVGRFPHIPAGQLASILHLHPSTLTGVLKRMQDQGLLQRRADAQDARRSLLELTDLGRQLDVEASGTVEAQVAGVLARTPGHKVRAARELLGQIATALVQSVEAPKRVEPSGRRGRIRRPPRRRRPRST